jgi:hypothetical protein
LNITIAKGRDVENAFLEAEAAFEAGIINGWLPFGCATGGRVLPSAPA